MSAGQGLAPGEASGSSGTRSEWTTSRNLRPLAKKPVHNLLCAGFFMLLGSWRIELLGGLRLIQAGRVVTRFRTRKAASLLAYLALYASRAHSRDSLADLLWPEADAESARRNLRQALYTLRLQ